MRVGWARKNPASAAMGVRCRSMSNKIFGGAGNDSSGESVMTRSDSSGIPWAAQARAMNSVSMSTAEAPDSHAILSRCSLESINAGTVNMLAAWIDTFESNDWECFRSTVEKFFASKTSFNWSS